MTLRRPRAGWRYTNKPTAGIWKYGFCWSNSGHHGFTFQDSLQYLKVLLHVRCIGGRLDVGHVRNLSKEERYLCAIPIWGPPQGIVYVSSVPQCDPVIYDTERAWRCKAYPHLPYWPSATQSSPFASVSSPGLRARHVLRIMNKLVDVLAIPVDRDAKDPGFDCCHGNLRSLENGAIPHLLRQIQSKVARAPCVANALAHTAP